ncbi:LexA-binding, inner membrane-associated putative hydrolase [uncultured archaeon]|nr:LexA-binding, inner membrane-associated putative hydrolase [uncultured archaeon]
MPDWFTHSLIGWITGKTIKQDVALVVIGSLIPDLVKIDLLFTWLQGESSQFFAPLHTPIGALLVAGIIAVSFQDIRKAFIPLIIGVSTHFILDFFLVHVPGGGMKLLFPFSWEGWQISLIRSDDYMVTVVAVLAAVIVYAIYRAAARRKKHHASP